MIRLVLCGLWFTRHRLGLGVTSLVLAGLFVAAYSTLEDNSFRFSLVVTYATVVAVMCSLPRILLGLARYVVQHRNGKYDSIRARLL